MNESSCQFVSILCCMKVLREHVTSSSFALSLFSLPFLPPPSSSRTPALRTSNPIPPIMPQHVQFPYHRLKKVHLTEKALADLNKLNTPPNLPPPPLAAMSSTDRKTNPYDRNFEEVLMDAGCFGDWQTEIPKPSNWNMIKSMIQQNPVICMEAEHNNFVKKANAAQGEAKIRSSVFPILRGNESDLYEEDLPFNNLTPLVPGISNAKPDIFYGSHTTQLKPQIRSELNQMIIPSKQSHHNIPMVPNLFLEAKGPDGSPAVLKRQILHDGSLGARGIHELRSWGGHPSFDNRAYTISATLHDGVLRLYTTHPSLHENKVVFFTNRVGVYCLEEDPPSLGKGLTAFRNSRAWAREQRAIIIAQANQRHATLLHSISNSSSSTGALANTSSSDTHTITPLSSVSGQVAPRFASQHPSPNPAGNQSPCDFSRRWGPLQPEKKLAVVHSETPKQTPIPKGSVGQTTAMEPIHEKLQAMSSSHLQPSKSFSQPKDPNNSSPNSSCPRPSIVTTVTASQDNSTGPQKYTASPACSRAATGATQKRKLPASWVESTPIKHNKK